MIFVEAPIKGILVLLTVLLIINMSDIVDAQARSAPDSLAGIDASTAIHESDKVTSADKEVQILGIDPTGFPRIKVNVFSNKYCAMSGNLKKEDFTIMEDGKRAIIDKIFCTCNASGQRLDLAVVFDDTGSMQQQIYAMKSKVNGLIDRIRASKIDANYSLVSFNDSVTIRTKWTSDPQVFKKSIETLRAYGGGDLPENSLDAIEEVLSLGFRPGAQKVVLVITDTNSHYMNDFSGFSNHTKSEVESDLAEAGVIFIPVSPTFEIPRNVDLKDVANETQSLWINMNSANFSAILEQFQWILTGSYVIEYTSPNQTPSEKRTVTIIIDAKNCLQSIISKSYISPKRTTMHFNAPLINNTIDKSRPLNLSTISWKKR
jgi:hypothetical protein